MFFLTNSVLVFPHVKVASQNARDHKVCHPGGEGLSLSDKKMDSAYIDKVVHLFANGELWQWYTATLVCCASDGL